MSEMWEGYPVRFDSDEDCPDINEWCSYPDAHRHGFACDETCPCRTDADRWAYRVPRQGQAAADA